MRRLAVLLFILLACSDSGPERLTADRVNGAWEFTLVKTAQCAAIALDGTFYASVDFAGDAEVGNTVSKWTNSRSVPDRFNLIGNIRYSSGDTELRFWQVVLSTGFIVEGTMRADGTFTGTADDPIPGYKPYLTFSGSGGCRYTVTGRRE